MNFVGAGNFNVGDGTGVETIKVDPSATGAIQLKNVANFATPTATDRILMLDPTSPTGDKVWTRSLSSLVAANQGLIVNNTVNPGTTTVQLGDTIDGNSPINTTRFITMTGASPSLTYDGTGVLNLGTSGNLNVTVKTGTQNFDVNTMGGNMTLQSTGLDVTGAAGNANNFLWVDTVSNQVHRARTSTMGRDNAALDFLAVDHTTGNIVRAISPTAGIFRGQIAGTGVFQYTSPAIPSLLAGASITCTIENHSGVLGAVLVQVTNITTGAGGTFSVETSDNIPAGSFINYVVMNP